LYRSLEGRRCENCVRQQAKFASGFNLIWVVQSRRQKYFAFLLPLIGGYSRPSRLDRGALRVVTDVERGMRWTRGAARRTVLTRTAKSCRPDTPTLVSSLRISAGDGGKKARFTEETTKETVKTTRAGKAGPIRLNLW
jgi:hypothetical protein